MPLTWKTLGNGHSVMEYKKIATCILCLLYCTPIYADKISDLEAQVAMLQEQLLGVQQDIRTLKAEKNITVEGRDTSEPKTDYRESAFMEERHKKEPRMSLKLKPGWAALTYQTRGDSPQKINTAGFAISSEVDVRLLKKTSFNLALDAFLPPEWSDMSDGFARGGGYLRNTHARLYTLSPNVRYKVLDTDKSTLGFSLGYEMFFQQFSHVGNAKGGHGPRFGIIADFSPTKKLSFTTEGFYTSFFDVEKEGRQRTEGHAFRFDISSKYRFHDRFELGTGYRGYLLSIDRNTKLAGWNRDEEFTRMDHLYGFFGISF